MMCSSSLQHMHACQGNRSVVSCLAPVSVLEDGLDQHVFPLLRDLACCNARELLNSRVRGGASSLATARWRRQGTHHLVLLLSLGSRFGCNLYVPFLLTAISSIYGSVLSTSVGKLLMSSLVKTAKLVTEDICLGPAFTKGESVPLEGDMPAVSHLLLLTNRKRLFVLVSLAMMSFKISDLFLDDLKSCPVNIRQPY